LWGYVACEVAAGVAQLSNSKTDSPDVCEKS
jgi:hypothetical protein